METQVNLDTLIPVIIAVLAPTLLGFLQQFQKSWVAKAPWYAKGLISSMLGAIIGMVTSYAANGDALMAVTGGAVVGALGAVNVAFRKGTRGNLEMVTSQKYTGTGDGK